MGKVPQGLHIAKKRAKKRTFHPAISKVVEPHNIVSGRKTKAQRRLERSFKSLEERAGEKHLSPQYLAYIKGPRWDATKRAYFQVVPRKCSTCTSLRPELHHLSYTRLGLEWWCDLTPLCHACHARVHAGRGRAIAADSRREPILPT